MIRIRSLSLVVAHRSIMPGLCAALLASTILPAHAQTADEAARTAERTRAEALAADGKALRAEAEATYQATVPGCYEKFLVNRCIDQAKKQRLETIRRARELEAESRGITLAERQRAAAAKPAAGERPSPPSPPAAPPAASPLAPSGPSGDATIAPSTEAERIRAQRVEASREAEAATARQRAAQDAERASARRDAEDAAARRARQAEEDRARYEKRLRDYEQEQAGKK